MTMALRSNISRECELLDAAFKYALCAWDSSLHLLVTQAQLIIKAWYWPKCCVLHSEWHCVTPRPVFYFILRHITIAFQSSRNGGQDLYIKFRFLCIQGIESTNIPLHWLLVTFLLFQNWGCVLPHPTETTAVQHGASHRHYQGLCGWCKGRHC